jgi:hypothetical protein
LAGNTHQLICVRQRDFLHNVVPDPYLEVAAHFHHHASKQFALRLLLRAIVRVRAFSLP